MNKIYFTISLRPLLFSLAIGTVAAAEPLDSGKKRPKLNFIVMNTKVVKDRVEEVNTMPFYAISIHHGKKENLDLNGLAQFLYNGRKSLSKISQGMQIVWLG